MAIEIEVATKDCTALTDAELAEMADLSATEAGGWEVGFPVEADARTGCSSPRFASSRSFRATRSRPSSG